MILPDSLRSKFETEKDRYLLSRPTKHNTWEDKDVVYEDEI